MSWLDLFTRSTRIEKDPVCGMDVDAARSKLSAEYEGKRYHFCAASCLQAFQNNPEEFLPARPDGVSSSDAHRQDHRQAHACD